MTWRPPHAFCHDHASSPTPPPSPRPNFIGLLCVLLKRQPHLRPRHPPHPSVFRSFSLRPLKQANQRHRMQSRWLTACAWRWGSAAPWFKRAASLPKEREGKATGADRHLVCVVFCCVFVCCKASILLAIGDLLHICELVQ
jgi:hypothetical protein